MRRTTLLLLGILVACGQPSTTPRAVSSDGVVPWIDTPYDAPTPAPLPPGVDPCSAEDLEFGRFGETGAAAGTSYARADVTNVSSSDCVLTAKSSVRYVDGDGDTVQTGALETYENAALVPTEASVSAGSAKRITLRLAMPGVCPPPAATSLEVRLFPGTETMQLPPGSGGSSPPPGQCAEAGHFALLVESTAQVDSPFSVLTAEIRAPETVAPGSTFRYLVHLRNPSGSALELDPCPGYTEGFKAPNGGQASYLMNCSDVRSIAPGSTVIYEMYLDVPEEFGPETNPEREALLVWLLLGGGPSASASVEVLG